MFATPFPGNNSADRINPVAAKAAGFYPGPPGRDGPGHQNNYAEDPAVDQ